MPTYTDTMASLCMCGGIHLILKALASVHDCKMNNFVITLLMLHYNCFYHQYDSEFTEDKDCLLFISKVQYLTLLEQENLQKLRCKTKHEGVIHEDGNKVWFPVWNTVWNVYFNIKVREHCVLLATHSNCIFAFHLSVCQSTESLLVSAYYERNKRIWRKIRPSLCPQHGLTFAWTHTHVPTCILAHTCITKVFHLPNYSLDYLLEIW